jgi:hypothetical protein
MYVKVSSRRDCLYVFQARLQIKSRVPKVSPTISHRDLIQLSCKHVCSLYAFSPFSDWMHMPPDTDWWLSAHAPDTDCCSRRRLCCGDGNVAQHLVSKGVDILALVSFALTTSGLIGRNCIMDITVSRYSLRRDDICFQSNLEVSLAGTISCFFGSAGSDSVKTVCRYWGWGVQ